MNRKLLRAFAVTLILAAPTTMSQAAESDCRTSGVCDTNFDYLDCDSACDSGCDGLLGGGSLFSELTDGWELSGWVNAGIVGNTASPASRFNGPYNAVDRSNEAMLNQAYLVAEKGLPHCGTGFGGRVDLMYGEDFLLAQSIGLERRPNGASHWNGQYYGLALPQAYLSAGSKDLNVQIGHFYSVVGYEGLMAPDNFFYSKSYSYQFAGPFTHWGAQMNWNASDAVTFNMGIHNGWDALDRDSDVPGFISKVRYADKCNTWWTSFAVTTGQETNNLAGVAAVPGFTNRTRYSWIVSQDLSSRTNYVFHHWLGAQENGAADGGRADWFGIDQYVTHKINNCWAAGLRAEWFRDEEGTRVGLNRDSNPNNPSFAGNFYSISAGLNYTPTNSLTIRPEMRGDWFDGTAAAKPFNDGGKSSQFLLGLDVILQI